MIHIQFLLPHLSAHRKIGWRLGVQPRRKRHLMSDLQWGNFWEILFREMCCCSEEPSSWSTWDAIMTDLKKWNREDAEMLQQHLELWSSLKPFVASPFCCLLNFCSFQHFKMTAAFQEMSDIKSKMNKWTKITPLLTNLRVKVRLVEWSQLFPA